MTFYTFFEEQMWQDSVDVTRKNKFQVKNVKGKSLY